MIPNLDTTTNNGGLSAFGWPPNGSDLNTTEVLGGHLDRQQNKREPASIYEL